MMYEAQTRTPSPDRPTINGAGREAARPQRRYASLAEIHLNDELAKAVEEALAGFAEQDRLH